MEQSTWSQQASVTNPLYTCTYAPTETLFRDQYQLEYLTPVNTILGVVLIFLLIVARQTSYIFFFLALTLNLILMVLFYAIASVYLPQNKLSRLINLNHGRLPQVTIRFDANAFSIQEENGAECSYSYQQLVKLKRGRKVLLLYMRGRDILPIPSAAFPDGGYQTFVSNLRKIQRKAAKAYRESRRDAKEKQVPRSPIPPADAEGVSLSIKTAAPIEAEQFVAATDIPDEAPLPSLTRIKNKSPRILLKIVYRAWVCASAAFLLLCLIAILLCIVDYFQGKASIERGDYISAWEQMDSANPIIPIAASYREYCAGMQSYDSKDYQSAEASFIDAGDVLDAQELAAACASELEKQRSNPAERLASNLPVAWDLTEVSKDAPDEIPSISIDASIILDSTQYHDYLVLADPGSIIRIENPKGTLAKNDIEMTEDGRLSLRIPDYAFYLYCPLTDPYYVMRPSFTIFNPDGTSCPIECGPILVQFPTLEIQPASRQLYWNPDSGETIKIEGKVSSSSAVVEVNGNPALVYDDGTFVYETTLDDRILQTIRAGNRTIPFYITAYDDNFVSAKAQVVLNLVG